VELINKAAHDSCTCVYSRRKYPAEDIVSALACNRTLYMRIT